MTIKSGIYGVVVGCLVAAAGCETIEPAVEYDGRNLYLGYCASCHGPDGRGDGPVAPALAAPLPDLRTLEARKGVFPRDWLVELIDGRTLRAGHGTAEMPVWGWQFRLAEDSAANADARMGALVGHLQGIQLEP